jgi:hypothetical protein
LGLDFPTLKGSRYHYQGSGEPASLGSCQAKIVSWVKFGFGLVISLVN